MSLVKNLGVRVNINKKFKCRGGVPYLIFDRGRVGY